MSTPTAPDLTSTTTSNPPTTTTHPPNPNSLTWSPSLTHPHRTTLLSHKGLTIWLTGLSASGKSTIASSLELHLLSPPHNHPTYRLDGDNIRHGLNADLGFSPHDRTENIRRIAHVAALFADACNIAITSFISPYRADRALARELHRERGLEFVEVWVDVSVEEAERRDPKGLYQKARRGELKEFTGVSAPYEEPEGAEIRIKGGETSVEEAVGQIVAFLEGRGYLNKGEVQDGGLVEM
ncbi:MAG: hypothetical protein Q9178_002642 [Gyalolechia marmorata]